MRNVLLLITVILTSGCSVTEKPNIIWITVEDQSAYFFPFYGNKDVSLPNLEEFSKESEGYTATKHQREVGVSYFDKVSEVLSSGKSSTAAMKDSTETDQFNE